MALNIKIDNFEGPFDLLLHLIKKSQMDIYDIKIHEITQQYIGYVNEMKEMDLDVTSEFIVIAATLLEIKSKMLLPKTIVDNGEKEEEEDPRKQLIDKLIEYNKFKGVAYFLREKEIMAGITFSKRPEIIDDREINKDKNFLKNVTMLELFNIYNNLISNYLGKVNQNHEIRSDILVDRFKVEDKMELLKMKILGNEKVKFSEIMKECTIKMEAIVTFLALLELVRLKVIKVYQENNFNEIYLERTSSDE